MENPILQLAQHHWPSTVKAWWAHNPSFPPFLSPSSAFVWMASTVPPRSRPIMASPCPPPSTVDRPSPPPPSLSTSLDRCLQIAGTSHPSPPHSSDGHRRTPWPHRDRPRAPQHLTMLVTANYPSPSLSFQANSTTAVATRRLPPRQAHRPIEILSLHSLLAKLTRLPPRRHYRRDFLATIIAISGRGIFDRIHPQPLLPPRSGTPPTDQHPLSRILPHRCSSPLASRVPSPGRVATLRRRLSEIFYRHSLRSTGKKRRRKKKIEEEEERKKRKEKKKKRKEKKKEGKEKKREEKKRKKKEEEERKKRKIKGEKKRKEERKKRKIKKNMRI